MSDAAAPTLSFVPGEAGEAKATLGSEQERADAIKRQVRAAARLPPHPPPTGPTRALPPSPFLSSSPSSLPLRPCRPLSRSLPGCPTPFARSRDWLVALPPSPGRARVGARRLGGLLTLALGVM